MKRISLLALAVVAIAMAADVHAGWYPGKRIRERRLARGTAWFGRAAYASGPACCAPATSPRVFVAPVSPSPPGSGAQSPAPPRG